MIPLKALILTLSTTAIAIAASSTGPSHLFPRQTITSSQTGTNNGYYYTFWTDGSGTQSYTNGPGGEYSVVWSGGGGEHFLAGKGWNPGSAQTITYNGTFAASNTAYFSVYGWTTSPLVQYYILESYAGANPASGPNIGYMGSLTSDGGTYDIYQSRPISQPITPAPDEFVTYWSIRQTQRVGGTVTTANHFNAWKALGAELGAFNYQLVATEGENSSGFSEITVD